MFKVARKDFSWNYGPGKAVAVIANPSDETFPNGVIQISLANRLTPEKMGAKRVVSPIAQVWMSKNRRLLITGLLLSPEIALLLRDALNDVIARTIYDDEVTLM